MTYRHFIKHIKKCDNDILRETHTDILDVIRESCSYPQTLKVKRIQKRAIKFADAIEEELEKRARRSSGSKQRR